MRMIASVLRFVVALALTAGLALGLSGQTALGACLDLAHDNALTLEGTLAFQVFAGPPYNGGVNKGDAPEPSYILKLDGPVCASGDDFLDANEKVDRVQIFPGEDNAMGIFKALRRLVGRRVRVEGKSAFGAHTGHHHAPLLLPIASIVETFDPKDADGGGMAAVQAFYLALAEGKGQEASRLVVPDKRASGPFSTRALTGFYGLQHLDEPLALTEVKRSGADEYRVRYTFVSPGSRRCDGAATVHTVAVKGEKLISAIKALNGC
jgi:Domain of unknown function (DUF4431)